MTQSTVHGINRSAVAKYSVVSAAMLSSAALAVAPAAADATRKFSKYNAAATAVFDHSAWDKLLKTYVVPGQDGLNRVRYRDFKDGGHQALKQYIKALERFRPTTLARPEQFAYWVNLYNAKTIDVVLDAYPVASIRDISIKGGLLNFLKKSVGKGGPWKAKIMQVEGEQLSLDDVEHGILRPIFKDPRVHYAVNCASVGCPNLQARAFTGANLEVMLDGGARKYINSPRGFRHQGGQLTASSIYSWFVEDFGGTNQGVLAHARKYADPQLAKKLAKAVDVGGYEYDWSLNDVR